MFLLETLFISSDSLQLYGHERCGQGKLNSRRNRDSFRLSAGTHFYSAVIH